MWSDYQTCSLHCFNFYTVQDRVNLDAYDDSLFLSDIKSVDVESILPTPEDENLLWNNMSVLIARTPKKHIPYFKSYGRGVKRHIKHKFYKMSQEPTVVTIKMC